MKDLTKELYYTPKDSTTVKEVEALLEKLISLTWTIDIYRNKSAVKINLKDLGWRIGFNNRKGSAGICKSRGRRNALGDIELYGKKIELSMHFLKQNLEEGKGTEWEEVIRHELAHAVDTEMRGTSDHSRTWKAVAHAMLSNGRRTFSSNELKDEKLSKYTLVCGSCGTKKASHKKKKRISACGKCCREHNGGKYTEKFALKQVQNY